jgi:hypothetical protein
MGGNQYDSWMFWDGAKGGDDCGVAGTCGGVQGAEAVNEDADEDTGDSGLAARRRGAGCTDCFLEGGVSLLTFWRCRFRRL